MSENKIYERRVYDLTTNISIIFFVVWIVSWFLAIWALTTNWIYSLQFFLTGGFCFGLSLMLHEVAKEWQKSAEEKEKK